MKFGISPLSSTIRRMDFIALIVSLMIFLALYGWRFVDPTNENWLIGTGMSQDTAQSQLGWMVFRADDWHFPVAVTSLNQYPTGTSMVFTDSIPIAGIFFKLVDGILPKSFQYMGLWTLLSFLLQGWFASKLLTRWIKDPVIVLMGVVIFVLSPIMLTRAFIHTSLTSHWLVLAALYLYFDTAAERRNLPAWIALAACSTLVHPYFTMMVGFVFAGTLVNIYMAGKRIDDVAVMAGAVLATTVLVAWAVAGFFIPNGGFEVVDFGNYAMNILAPIDPRGWSAHFLKDLPISSPGAYEGANYLGLSILVLTPIVLLYRFSKPAEQPVLSSALVPGAWVFGTICTALALSNVVSFGAQQVLTLNLPEQVLKYLSMFRASGRLFYPVYYLVVIYVFVNFEAIARRNFSRTPVIIFLAILVSLQAFDQMAPIEARSPEKREGVGTKGYDSPLKSGFWRGLMEGNDHIVLLDSTWANIIPAYQPFWALASYTKATVNTGYYARYDGRRINEFMTKGYSQLSSGVLEEKTVYVLLDRNDISRALRGKMLNPDVMIAEVDGRVVAWNRATFPGFTAGEVTKLYDTDSLDFRKMGALRFTTGLSDTLSMVSGWSGERAPTPTWSVGDTSVAELYVGKGAHRIAVKVHPLLGTNLSEQRVFVQLNGTTIGFWTVTKSGEFEMPLPMELSKPDALNVFTFIYPDGRSPKSLGLDGDERKRAVAFEWIKVMPQ